MTRSPARPRLRTQLIAWYASSLCLVLLIAAVSVRFAVAHALEQAHAESVAASVELFRQFFRVELAEYRSIDATLVHIATELVFEDRVIDVHRPDGELFVPPGRLGAHQYPSLRAPVRVISAPLDPVLAPGWTIEVHASAATLAAAARRIDLWMLGGIPLVVVTAALLGWWLAGRALRPIAALATQAQSLDAHSGSRLVLEDPRDEVGRVGTSFNTVLDRLDAANLQQRRFLADAAHELRTPIARLRSRVELGRLELTQATSEAAPRHASETLRGLDQELRVTSDVLDGMLALARADAGSTEVTMVEGFLDDALADELPRWRETAKSAGITISLGAYEEVFARFDAALMHRLLGVLLDNAIHYSPSGSTVTIGLSERDGSVTLRVEDEGIGIPEAERTLVFRRFHRAREARERRADGSGLGLSLAQWIVERHGGALHAEGRADGARGVALVATWPVGTLATPQPSTPPVPHPTPMSASSPAVTAVP